MNDLSEYKIIDYGEVTVYDQRTGEVLCKLEPPIDIEPHIIQACPLCRHNMLYRYENNTEEWICPSCGFSSLDSHYIPRGGT